MCNDVPDEEHNHFTEHQNELSLATHSEHDEIAGHYQAYQRGLVAEAHSKRPVGQSERDGQ